MRAIYFILTISFLSIGCTSAQKDDFAKDTKHYLAITGTWGHYEEVTDQLMSLLKQQYAMQKAGDGIWTALSAEKDIAINDIQDQLIEAYRGHFTHGDIKAMNIFYESDTGKRLGKDISGLTEQDKKNLNAFNQSGTGEKIAASQEPLNGVMTQITEKWSGDLYKKNAKLAEKGFSAPQ